MNDITTRIQQIISDKLGVEQSDITMDADFNEDLGADPLDSVELVMALEKEFEIDIPDEVAEKMRRLHDVLTFVTSRQTVK